MSIIITRPQEDSEIFAGELAKLNLTYFIEPLFAIQNILNKEAVSKEINIDCDFIVITSKNAISSIPTTSTNIISIGKSTTSILKESGFNNVEYAGENVNNLCEYIKKEHKESNITYLSGNNISLELNKDTCGANVQRIVVYNTLPITSFSEKFKNKIKNNEFSAVTLFSNKSAEIFIQTLQAEDLDKYIKNLYAFCFSYNTAKSIEKYGFRATISTKNSDIDNFVRLIANFSFNK